MDKYKGVIGLNSIGHTIKELRLQRGLTQEQLVNELVSKFQYPINVATLSLCENDKRMPSLELVRYIAQYFQCSMDDLLGIKNIREDNINDLKYLAVKKFIEIIDEVDLDKLLEIIEFLIEIDKKDIKGK